jgi:hypothetical protein
VFDAPGYAPCIPAGQGQSIAPEGRATVPDSSAQFASQASTRTSLDDGIGASNRSPLAQVAFMRVRIPQVP